MGKRASMFQCLDPDCRAEFWEWFEWLTPADLHTFADETQCPECGSGDWQLTDTSEFAGGQLSGEAGYPPWLREAPSAFAAREYLGIHDLQARVRELEWATSGVKVRGETTPADNEETDK